MDYFHFIQWPAMVVTFVSAWLVASQSERRRTIGFYSFLLSNILWITWGWNVGAFALIFLQIGLAVNNIRGAVNNRPESS